MSQQKQWSVPAAHTRGQSLPVRNMQLIELMDGLTLVVSADRGWQVRRIAEEIYRQYGGREREG